MGKPLVAVCHRHHPGALGQYYERALRLDPGLRGRYDLVTVGPSTNDHPMDIHYDGTRPVREAFAAGLPDIFLYLDGLPLTPLGLMDMPSVNVFLCSDWQKHFYWFSHMARLFDFVLTPWREAEDGLRRAGVRELETTFWAGFDPEIYRPIELPKAYDVTFVGMIDPQLCRYRGRAMEQLIALSAEGVRVNLMQGVWYGDVAAAYSQSRIVFNKGWDNGYNARAMEAMACGSMLLTHAVDGDEARLGFRDREHLVFYHSDDEIPDLVRYYLDHDDERESIARAGQKAVAERFTYAHRVDDVLRRVESWRCGRDWVADRLPADEIARCEAVSAYYAGAHDVAVRLFSESGKEDALTMNDTAVALGALGRHDEALARCARAAEASDGFALPLINQAVIEIRAGRGDAAGEALREAVRRLTAEDTDECGLTFYDGYDAFKWDFERALFSDIGEVEKRERLRRNLLCRAYELTGDVAAVDDAVEAYRQTVELRADDGHLRLKLGQALARCGDVNAAEAEVARAIEMEPLFAEAQEFMCSLLSGQDRMDEGAGLFRRYMHTNPLFRPDRAPACRELGDLFERADRPFDACVWWDACLALEREIPELRQKLIDVCARLTDEALAADPARSRPTVALAQIARNEESCIEDSLRSVADLVDEMVVLDTGSTDATREIAERCGARVVETVWPEDFADARNEAIRHVNSDWIVMLDADEVISPEGRDALDRYIRCGLWDAIQMNLVTYIDNPQIVGYRAADDRMRSRGKPGYYLNPLVRVFRNTPEIRFEGRVHETVLASLLRMGGRIAHTSIGIDHYTDTKDPGRIDDKHDMYLELCERNIAERPGDIKALLEAGTQLRDLGEFDRAVEVFERALKINPHFVWAVAGMLETALVGGCHFRAARRAIDLFEETRPVEMPEVLINYGLLLMRMGELDAARHRIETAVAAAPENAVGHYLLGLICESEGNDDAADGAFSRALAITPEYDACKRRRETMNVRRTAAEMMGRGEAVSAVRSLRQALTIDPGNELVINDLAVILYNEGETGSAADLLRRAVEKHPWTELLCDNYRDIMVQLGRGPEAEDVLKKSREKMEGVVCE
jgi:tetratricopeptide (TPR) repeat protein